MDKEILETHIRDRLIQHGSVTVNGEVCTMRGKKIRRGDEVSVENFTVRVI